LEENKLVTRVQESFSALDKKVKKVNDVTVTGAIMCFKTVLLSLASSPNHFSNTLTFFSTIQWTKEGVDRFYKDSRLYYANNREHDLGKVITVGVAGIFKVCAGSGDGLYAKRLSMPKVVSLMEGCMKEITTPDKTNDKSLS